MRGTINICQPGCASCALCCGSHNIAGGRAAMLVEFAWRAALFGARGRRPKARWYSLHAHAGGASIRPALHDDAIRCPLAGFIDADRTLVGCLAYSRPPESDAARGFFERTCRTFSCPARETLTTRRRSSPRA